MSASLPHKSHRHQRERKKASPLPTIFREMSRRHRFQLLLLFFVVLTTATFATGRISSRLGINYGQLGDDLPIPAASLRLIGSINAGGVKVYDADPAILSALADSNLPLSIMVPNQLIPSLAANSSSAARWVETNLLPFLPKARIRYLLVGNEVLSDYSVKNSTWPYIVPAMVNVHKVLASRSIHNIKIGTTLAMDALDVSFPPSSSEFRSDIAMPIVLPLLKFLQKTRSFYFVDAYPYFVWSENPNSVSLDYALLDPNTKPFVDPNTKLIYRNMLEQQLDAVAFAMEKLGVPDVRISIAETGWPNAGDYDQIGANVRNAATYNRNLAKWVSSGARTPARPGPNKSPAFVFALYNENRKGGRGTERHWGVFYSNGSSVYDVDLSGRTAESRWKPLPAADNDEPYKGKIWCVATEQGQRNATLLAEAVAYACSQGNHTCDAIRPGGRCWTRYSVVARASYAFNEYWQQFRSSGATCFFNGLAAQTIKDPSLGSCVFRST